MKLNLTRQQTRALRRHFAAVTNAYENNGYARDSMLVAQVWGPDSGRSNGTVGCLCIGFLQKEDAKRLVHQAAYRVLCPLGYGIPEGHPRQLAVEGASK